MLLVSVLLLSGCNSIENARTDIHAENVVFGPKHSSQMLLGRCLKDGSANAYEECDAEFKFISAGASFRENSLEASRQAADEKAVIRYINSGVALADLYCERFFRQISQSAAHRKYLRSQVNDVGGLFNALLNATGASTGTVGASSAIFTLLDGSAENYDAAFLVAPDLSRVEQLVERAQDEYLSTKGSKIENFYEAQRFLLRYANSCSFNGIRGLINQSIEAAKPKTDEKTGTQFIDGGNKVTAEVPAAAPGTTPGKN